MEIEALQNDVGAFFDDEHKIFEAADMKKNFDALCLIADSDMDRPITHVVPVSR